MDLLVRRRPEEKFDFQNFTAKSEKKKRVLRFLVSWPNIVDWQCTWRKCSPPCRFWTPPIERERSASWRLS